MPATTEEITLSTTAWTLIADGDADITDALIKLSAGDKALIAIATATPAPSVLTGVSLMKGEPPLPLRLASGCKVFARSTAPGTALVCASWGPTGA